MEIIDETTTLFVIFSLFLLTYYRANTPDDLLCRSLLGNVLNYLSPMLLIVFTFMFFMYENYKSKKKPLGIFQRKMIWKFIMAPFHTPTFREIYAADYLTSFTKIISDAVRAACFIFSGEFLLHVGDTNTTWFSSQANNIGIAAAVASMVPLLIRLAQCMRLLYETRQIPHLFNAIKYGTSMVVVIWGLWAGDMDGDDISYICFIILSTLYKAFWDMYMDWGFFERSDSNCSQNLCNNSKSYIFLRSKIIYTDSIAFYYVAIVLDIILRFLWVVSLVPLSSNISLLDPKKTNVYLGSFEIIRRCMWGHFRIEYAQIVAIQKGKEGFFQFHETFQSYVEDRKMRNSSPGRQNSGHYFNSINSVLPRALNMVENDTINANSLLPGAFNIVVENDTRTGGNINQINVNGVDDTSNRTWNTLQSQPSAESPLTVPLL